LEGFQIERWFVGWSFKGSDKTGFTGLDWFFRRVTGGFVSRDWMLVFQGTDWLFHWIRMGFSRIGSGFSRDQDRFFKDVV